MSPLLPSKPIQEALPPDLTLARFFLPLPDPRLRRARRHPLLSLLFIVLCAILAGADSLLEIMYWAHAKQDWLAERIDLPNGIPSHDTLGRVLARLDPDAFRSCFTAWTQALHQKTTGEVIALDGKTVRGSLDKAAGIPALHLVSAWAAENRLSLCQQKVAGHDNEISAAPSLLALLDIRGCIITGDAMLCQKDIASQVVTQGGDYVLALKDNHPILQERVEEFFTYWRERQWQTEIDQAPITHQFVQTMGKGHGRLEVRRCWLVEDAQEWLDTDQAWSGLRSVAALESERRVNGKVSYKTRYFLTSLSGPDAARRVLRSVRAHWGIENRLHWVLDVVFREDEKHISAGTGHLMENLTLVHKRVYGVLCEIVLFCYAVLA